MVKTTWRCGASRRSVVRIHFDRKKYFPGLLGAGLPDRPADGELQTLQANTAKRPKSPKTDGGRDGEQTDTAKSDFAKTKTAGK
jgi:hypothetical protein